MSDNQKKKPVIGRREWFCIPELGLDWMRGKSDTGARTSSLHATRIKTFEKGREMWVSFRSVDDKECEAPVMFVKNVKSSNGEHSMRYFIEVTAESPDDRKHHLLVSLTCRKAMKCPLLLGRRALTGFLVDCSHSMVLGKR